MGGHDHRNTQATDNNKNIQVARYLIDHLRKLRPDAQRDGVRLYCDYLDRAMAEA